jgi:hypothetical protein
MNGLIFKIHSFFFIVVSVGVGLVFDVILAKRSKVDDVS